MDIKELLLTAGSSVLNVFAPGAGTMVGGLIRNYLDDDIDVDKLTGDEAAAMISKKLTPAEQSTIFSRKVDLEIQKSIERMNRDSGDVEFQRIQTEEIISGNSPRPYAVKKMVDIMAVQVYAIFGLCTCMLIVNGILLYNGKPVLNITDVLPGIEIFGFLFSAPATVIIRYFTNRSQDKKHSAIIQAGGTVEDLTHPPSVMNFFKRKR